MERLVPPALIDAMKKQKYHFAGRHSAVKRCRWLHETLIQNRPCYKQKFYGIRTHQCIQMTPTAFYCTQQCLFCWRAQSGELESTWSEMKLPKWDSPDEIAECCIRAQQRILSGYKGNPRTNKNKLREARVSKHVAISLTGEPTLYKHIGSLIETFHTKGLTTFLVTNGTVPSALKKLDVEPTQLYVSVCAPNEKVYKRLCRPKMPKSWERLNETLTLLPSLKCPKVMRITSVRGLNMTSPEGYAELIEKSKTTYVEVKAYMHVGFSRLRLDYRSMPTHEEIREFSNQLTKETGYYVIDESRESRVVLLSRLKKTIRFDNE